MCVYIYIYRLVAIAFAEIKEVHGTCRAFEAFGMTSTAKSQSYTSPRLLPIYPLLKLNPMFY